MNNKRIIIGVTIGITAAILWSVVFINVLNSMVFRNGILLEEVVVHIFNQILWKTESWSSRIAM